jgi:hypothetical protein
MAPIADQHYFTPSEQALWCEAKVKGEILRLCACVFFFILVNASIHLTTAFKVWKCACVCSTFSILRD